MTRDFKKLSIDEPAQVGFYQFLRLIQSTSGRRLGEDLKPYDEPVRLKADPHAAFPVNEVARTSAVSIPKRETLTALEVSFFGLFGASGALPQHYTQLIIDRMRAKDDTLREFLDLFNHRLLSLFYRAWEKHHFPIAHETAASNGREDVLTNGLWSLIGIRDQPGRNRLRIADAYQLFFSGHFSRRRPIASALESMLTMIFKVSTHVLAFQGQWMVIPRAEQTRFANSPLGVSMNNRLGVDAVAGERIWDLENRFRIRVGPVSFAKFIELTPMGTALVELMQWSRRYVGPQFDFDVQLVIKADEVPGMVLGHEQTSRLGWSTWLGHRPQSTPADDPVFEFRDAML